MLWSLKVIGVTILRMPRILCPFHGLERRRALGRVFCEDGQECVQRKVSPMVVVRLLM
jgi:hypothetical protein